MDVTGTTTWRFLLGFYQVEEALTLSKSQGLTFSPEQEADLRRRIAKANSFVSSLKSRTRADVKLTDPPSSIADHLSKLAAEPTFGECTTGMASWSWKIVDLPRLQTFQPSVNWDYVQKLTARVPPPEDLEALTRFCLPLAGSGESHRIAVAFNPVINSYSLVSEHLDLRIVGQVQGEDPNTKRKFFGFVTGFGLPTMTVVRYHGMSLLKNGYHRAVALLSKGHRRAPALVVETDSYPQTGAASPGFFNIDVLTSPKAPLLSDFVSDAAVDISRPQLRTVVSIHGEAQQLAL